MFVHISKSRVHPDHDPWNLGKIARAVELDIEDRGYLVGSCETDG